MKPWLILINDFCHDLFTGLWFGSFVTLWILHHKAGAAVPGSPAAGVLTELTGFFTWMCFAALGLIVMTGVFRFFYYRDWDGVAMKDVKKRLLIIKHAVLGSSFLLGTGIVLAWTL